MAKFVANVPQTTTTQTITVDAGSLQPGTYTFQLVVQDATGRKSAPASVTVTVTSPLTRVIR